MIQQHWNAKYTGKIICYITYIKANTMILLTQAKQTSYYQDNRNTAEQAHRNGDGRDKLDYIVLPEIHSAGISTEEYVHISL